MNGGSSDVLWLFNLHSPPDNTLEMPHLPMSFGTAKAAHPPPLLLAFLSECLKYLNICIFISASPLEIVITISYLFCLQELRKVWGLRAEKHQWTHRLFDALFVCI